MSEGKMFPAPASILGTARPRKQFQPSSVSQTRFAARVSDCSGHLRPDAASPVIDPVVYFKLQLLTSFEGIGSERRL